MKWVYYIPTILKWMKLEMGYYEPLFLNIQPNLITHLERVWNPMLFMSLLILSIVFFQNFMDLLADVLYWFNKYGGIIGLSMSM